MHNNLSNNNKSSKRIALSEPVINGNEWKYVKECLDSGWVSSAGKFVDLFASEFQKYVGSKYAVPTNSGTSALHVSLIALNLNPDEEVLVPALTFIATANVVRYCGAFPVFMDVDEKTLCMDVEKVKSFLQKECVWSDGSLINKLTGRKVRGIIPVHLYGHPVDMDPLIEIAQKFNLFIIEDATEALGSKYKGKMIGTFGQTGCFSFNGNKIITTGGGGMVVTDDPDLAEHIRHLTTQAKKPGSIYYHTEIGYNYRLTNIQSALGLAQLERIQEFLDKRRAIALYYQQKLNDIPGIIVCNETKWASNCYWLSWILVEADYGKSKDELLQELINRKIEARSFFVPLHTLPPYQSCLSYQISKALDLYSKGINLPSHTTLENDDLDFVVSVIKDFIK